MDEVVIEGAQQPGVGYCTHRYFPATGGWMSTSPNLPAVRNHTAEVLLNGTLMLSGGWNPNDSARKTSFIFTPGSVTPWTPGPMLSVRRAGHRSVKLPGLIDRVVLIGGFNAAPTPTPTCDLYQ
jgi:hypothetical protein